MNRSKANGDIAHCVSYIALSITCFACSGGTSKPCVEDVEAAEASSMDLSGDFNGASFTQGCDGSTCESGVGLARMGCDIENMYIKGGAQTEPPEGEIDYTVYAEIYVPLDSEVGTVDFLDWDTARAGVRFAVGSDDSWTNYHDDATLNELTIDELVSGEFVRGRYSARWGGEFSASVSGSFELHCPGIEEDEEEDTGEEL